MNISSTHVNLLLLLLENTLSLPTRKVIPKKTKNILRRKKGKLFKDIASSEREERLEIEFKRKFYNKCSQSIIYVESWRALFLSIFHDSPEKDDWKAEVMLRNWKSDAVCESAIEINWCNVSGNCCKLMEIFCSKLNYWRQLFSFFLCKTWTICTSRVNEKRLNICWELIGTQIYFFTHFCL